MSVMWVLTEPLQKFCITPGQNSDTANNQEETCTCSFPSQVNLCQLQEVYWTRGKFHQEKKITGKHRIDKYLIASHSWLIVPGKH